VEQLLIPCHNFTNMDDWVEKKTIHQIPLLFIVDIDVEVAVEMFCLASSSRFFQWRRGRGRRGGRRRGRRRGGRRWRCSSCSLPPLQKMLQSIFEGISLVGVAHFPFIRKELPGPNDVDGVCQHL
jgi:hypothetical protein